MDGEYRNALNLAKWEHAHGLRSSYFVLHTTRYWQQEKADVLRVLHEIADLGHEVSLHNDTLTVALQTGRDPFAVLEDMLAELRAEGFPCLGTAAHGSTETHAAGVINYDMFAECSTDAFRARWTPRPMSDFGLTYEAYKLGYAHYLSDNGGKWNVPPLKVKADFQQTGGGLVVLMHPCHWRI
jgi:hypothetical protein